LSLRGGRLAERSVDDERRIDALVRARLPPDPWMVDAQLDDVPEHVAMFVKRKPLLAVLVWSGPELRWLQLLE
jgi:hypothetical protein